MNLRKELELLRNPSSEIGLMEMLEAREQRVIRQNRIIKTHTDGAIVCFTMNIAGPNKTSPAIKKAFDDGLSKIKQMLSWNHMKVTKRIIVVENTGYEAYLAVEASPHLVKNVLVQIEEGISIGRLFDIDVLDMNGEKISRTQSGKPLRKCIVCGENGLDCSSRRLHSIEEIQEKTISMICDYFNELFIDRVAENAVKALMYEAATTPKPGLVDMDNNGSHKDMNFFTFINSSASLQSYFRDCARAGVELTDTTPQNLFRSIRYRGRLAEENMYRATDNINTHKGAIFSLGIICAAIGYIYGNDGEANINTILNLCSEMASLSLHDFDSIDKIHPSSFGESLYLTKKLNGVRGEASRGYPSVLDIGYPVLTRLIDEGMTLNDAGAVALISMLCEVDDTNVIKRSNVETLRNVQNKVRKLIKLPSMNILKALPKLNDEFVALNISPGGCADMLAICYMIYFTENE